MYKRFLLSSLALFSLVGLFAQASFSGGTGTKTDPYLISNIEDLKMMSKEAFENKEYAQGVYFKQTADITLTRDEANGNLPTIGGHTGTYDDDGHAIINKFMGSYDGDNHTISGMCLVSDKPLVALFPYLGSTASVKNLRFSNGYIAGMGIQGFVSALNEGVVENCFTDKNCTVISAEGYLGGIVGNNTQFGQIIKCTNAGLVRGVGFAGLIFGGICADNEGVISDCVNKGHVTGSAYVGGIAGMTRNTANVAYCYNIAKIKATQNETAAGVGGISGGVVADETATPTLMSCYNVGDVNGPSYAGAVVGFVSPENAVVTSNCYFAEEMVSVTDSRATGLSNEDMKTDDFVARLNGDEKHFAKDEQSENNGFPVLKPANQPEEPVIDTLVVADQEFTIKVGKYYFTQFFTDYPQEMWNYVKSGDGKQFVTRYTSNDTKVAIGGVGYMQGIAPGTADVMVEISKPKPNEYQVFDEENIIATAQFKVNVQENPEIRVPAVSSWDSKKEDVFEHESSEGRKDFTEKYFELVPNASQGEFPTIITMGHGFFPILISSFNDEGKLGQVDIVVNNRNMVQPEAEVYQALLLQGYKYLGTSTLTNGWVLYNDDTKTYVTNSLIRLQGVIRGLYTMIHDVNGTLREEVVPDKIEATQIPNATFSTNIPGLLEVKVNQPAPHTVIEVYNIAGQLIDKQDAKQSGNIFNLHDKAVFVKITGCKAVKILL